MTPDKRLLYNTHKYMLQSLPSLPAMPAFPTAAFHPSLLQSACTNLSSRTELQISWCCCCVFSLPGKQRVLCTGQSMCVDVAGAVTQRLWCSPLEGGSPSGLLGAVSPTGKQETC